MWLLFVCFLVLRSTCSSEVKYMDNIVESRISQNQPWYIEEVDIPCVRRNCFLRVRKQDDVGPFWANRGKRGPTYTRDVLYAEEPQWVELASDSALDDPVLYNPFYVTRGKKNRRKPGDESPVRERRVVQKVLPEESPFFAARGKKAGEP